MAITADIFRAVAAVGLGASKRITAEHDEFLAFYRELVETVPTDVAKSFGRMSVNMTNGAQDWKIELSATDYIWWKEKFADGARFSSPPAQVRLNMLTRLAKKVEEQRLEPSERAALLALLDAPTA